MQRRGVGGRQGYLRDACARERKGTHQVQGRARLQRDSDPVIRPPSCPTEVLCREQHAAAQRPVIHHCVRVDHGDRVRSPFTLRENRVGDIHGH
jgi:hypothetical protein